MNAIAEKWTPRSGRCIEPENLEGRHEFFDNSAGRTAGRACLARVYERFVAQADDAEARGSEGWLVLTIESSCADR